MICEFSTREGGQSSLRISSPKSSEKRPPELQSPVERPILPSTSVAATKTAQLSDLNIGDLELLHHFTTKTCFTLSNQPRSHQLWQVAVPQEALRHDFLMRGILAVAALHLAHLRPDKQQEYVKVAVQHQHLALSGFRLNMSKTNQSNCHAFFALSSLIVVFAFASPRGSESLAFTEDSQEPQEWLPLIRGVYSILMSQWTWIQSGPLGGLLQEGIEHIEQPNRQALSDAAENQFAQLLRLCETLTAEPDVLAAYRIAVEELRTCYVKLYTKHSTECEVSIAFLWPVCIPERFIAMLNSRRPEALIVMAHYCVILNHLNGYWWRHGWTAHLMSNIFRELDACWHSWIQWPMTLIHTGHCSKQIIPSAQTY